MKISFAASSAFLIATTVFGHALPTPIIKGLLQVRGNALLNPDGGRVELFGVNLPELSLASPPKELAFKVIRQRWNLNTVRIPVSISAWRQQPDAYLSAAVAAVEAANKASLAVVLVARGDAGLSSPEVATFWRAWAERFKNYDRVVFDLYDKPSGRDWQAWSYAMRQIAAAIRQTGANQVLAVQGFADGFQGFDSTHQIPDANVIYEVHPAVGMTAAERDAQFGFLSARLHLYAGDWGLPLGQDTEACRRLPRDVQATSELVYDLSRYFDARRMSWTASTFAPGSLIVENETYSSTKLERPWTCGENSNPPQGMGELLLLAITGDPTGFGELLPETIANAATGLTGAIAPGEIIWIFGHEVGPYPGVAAEFDAEGNAPALTGGVRVLFDGVAAPVFYAYAYQVNVQVPYTVAGKTSTRAQLFYDGVPSSVVELPVAAASPGIFSSFSKEAKALNQDGTLNGAAAPATAGSVVVLFGTGSGEMTVERAAGRPAAAPLGAPALPVSVRIGSVPAEILYAGEAPGLIGVLQLNVRVPQSLSGTRAVTRPVELSIGSHASASTVTIWVR